jgi:hypothetical protein
MQPMVDDSGEDDETFFRRRPDANVRVRLPIAGEFPPGAIDPGRVAFVHVQVERDPATGEPGTRARAIFYTNDEGRA